MIDCSLLAQNPPSYQNVGTLGLLGIAWILSAIASFFIGWWFNYHQLTLKRMDTARENLRDVQEKRKEHRKAHVECDDGIGKFIGLLNADAPIPDIDAAREEVCATLIRRVVPHFHDCMEWEHLTLADKGLAEDLVNDDIVPELRWFGDWLEILNNSAMLEKLGGRQPVRIEKRFLNPFYEFLKGVPPNRHHACKAMLGHAITRIIDAGRPD